MNLKNTLRSIGFCGLLLTGASALGPTQAAQADENRQLSEKSHKAIANLHALNEARAAYSGAAAEVAEAPAVRTFFKERNMEYQKADARLGAFALTYGVDLNSPQMEKMTKKTEDEWAKENKKIREAKGDKANVLALNTFITRNNKAITSLRTLRGEVQEAQLQTMINDRISALEQESTTAQQLRAAVKEQGNAK
jgi:hypothetical protein